MLKALLADDDDIFARYVRICVDWELLKTELSARARTGFEAMELAAALDPDIVIMDVEMPGPNGLECIAGIRERRQDCEILLVTGHDEFEYAQSGVRYGVTEILLKPMPRRTLEAALTKAVNRYWEKHVVSVTTREYMGVGGEYGALKLLEEEAAEQSSVALAAKIIGGIRENDMYKINEAVSQYVLSVNHNFLGHSQIFWLNAFPPLLCSELLSENNTADVPLPFGDRKKLLETVRNAMLSETLGQTLFELCSRTASAIARKPSGSSTHVTDRAYYIIQEHYYDPKFNVSSLAGMMHFHEGYLRRVFKAAFGKSPATVLKDTRMAAAKKLIEEGELQIQQVARSVGFEDASYFSKCFKQYYGYSPKDSK